MSPSFRGSDPYPCGSLTYRMLYGISHIYYLYYAKTNKVSTRGTGEILENSENGRKDWRRSIARMPKYTGKRKKTAEKAFQVRSSLLQ
jgi:hypothetical protein